jgi:hypothetical protein
MTIKLNPTKANIVVDLLRANGNSFTSAQLLKSAGNDRRARSALSHARMAGIKLEPVRDGKTVTSYRTTSTPAPIAGATSTRKASKAATPKAAATAKVTKGSLESAVRKINASSKVKKQLATAKTDEDIAAIKAKNLATIKAVGAKLNQDVHPVTKLPITSEQKAVLDEFAQMEREAEAEREDREFARASVREYLTKEVYAE